MSKFLSLNNKSKEPSAVFLASRSKTKFILALLLCIPAFIPGKSQDTIFFSGIVLDSINSDPLPFVSVAFDNAKHVAFTENDGCFKIFNHQNDRKITISRLGYQTKHITLETDSNVFNKIILLNKEDHLLNEIIVRPQKERYSKKQNPAVALIEKVIANKGINDIRSRESYSFEEYSRITIADMSLGSQMSNTKSRFHHLTDSSLIDKRLYLPLSIRETIKEHFFRKSPKAKRLIVKAAKISGVDNIIKIEGLDEPINNLFSDISIYDNTIHLLDYDFISPLNDNNAVNFYRWYLTDTIIINNSSYSQLDFIPFNSHDIGFAGTLYISTDGSYAVKRSILRFSKKINLNFVNNFYESTDYNLSPEGIWLPEKQQIASELSLSAAKAYIEKERLFNNFIFKEIMDSVFINTSPVIYADNFNKQPNSYWDARSKENHSEHNKADSLIKELRKFDLANTFFAAAKFFTMGYFSLSNCPETSKFEIGTLATLYSYNLTEGHRMRITLASTKNFHPHFYLWTYGAFGSRDKRFKYNTEFTWTFNEVVKYKDEFPKNNITLLCGYDINSLGQNFSSIQRDNILMSLKSSDSDKITYLNKLELTYCKEFYNGFSFQLSASSSKDKAARNIVFEKRDENGNIYTIPSLNLTKTSLKLHYGYNEKHAMSGRKRYLLSSNRYSIDFTHNIAIKGVLGGEYSFNNSVLKFSQVQRIAPFGKYYLSIETEKFWGKAPYIFLPTPLSNNSYDFQQGSYNLISPLEFIHDSQVKLDFNYYMGGWLFNRIPLLKHLRLREVFGFRGFYGQLSKANNPEINNLILIPSQSYITRNGVPYLEYNVGIENIFLFFRIDYVRRLTYLDHPGAKKQGLCFSINFKL